MATMFRKPKRNFRQRIVRDDSDDEHREEDMETQENNESLDIKPIADIKKSKEKKKKEKSKGVLSFDHDEGNDMSFRAWIIIVFTHQSHGIRHNTGKRPSTKHTYAYTWHWYTIFKKD